jgi:hypothetical protein
MKKLIFIVPFVFIGCSVNNAPVKVKEFAKCYIHKLPAPFWVCYENSFMSVGKIKTAKKTRLAKQEAYAVGMKNLVQKLVKNTKKFLKKLDYKDEKILQKVKSFVLMNSIDDGSWYDKKEHVLYVKVVVDKNDFKNFLFNELKNYDRKVLEVAFDESF